MRLAVLFSGGKDSTLALKRAMDKEEVACLISIISKNKESYMFHTPNISMTELQAEALGLKLVKRETEGEKEDELNDLRAAIVEAKEKHGIDGVVTGAVESVYQSIRVQRICADLGLWCFNPLWQMDQVELLRETLKQGFKTIISGVFAYPFDDSWLGREIDEKMIDELIQLKEKFRINPAGEGGEIETTVLHAPFFKKKIIIKDSEKHFANNAGTLDVIEAVLG